MPNPYIVVNEYLPDGGVGTGHTNISFYNSSGVLEGTYGANVHDTDFNPANGLSGGIYNETDPNRLVNYATTHYLDQTTYNATKALAVGSVANGSQDYFIVLANCVDFVHKILNFAGVPHDLGSMFHAPGLVAYASTIDFFIDSWGWLQDQLQFNANENLFQMIDNAFQTWDDVWIDYDDTWSWITDDGVFHVSAYASEKEDHEDDIRNSAYSPIIIDLDGDGIETTRYKFAAINPSVYFDLDGDGTADRTAWVKDDDAFLVRDLNSDGVVNNGLEMFGGAARGEGFAELAALDENEDGVLNASDSGFASLLLWLDADGDGATDIGELRTLASVGLTEIGVTYENWDARDHGNLLGEKSVAVINGVAHAAVDVYFQAQVEHA